MGMLGMKGVGPGEHGNRAAPLEALGEIIKTRHQPYIRYFVKNKGSFCLGPEVRATPAPGLPQEGLQESLPRHSPSVPSTSALPLSGQSGPCQGFPCFPHLLESSPSPLYCLCMCSGLRVLETIIFPPAASRPCCRLPVGF